jgi:hypothetical protein
MFGAALGALWYVAIMSHNFTFYVGADDPQLAGEAVMGAGLMLFLAREKAGASVIMPLLIMVAGGFWKHSMIAVPLTAVAWLLIRRGWESCRPVLISAAVAGSGLFVCRAIFGADFFKNLFVARDYSFGHVLGNIGHLQWSAPAIAICMVCISRDRSDAARFSSLHVPIGFAACILQWFGDQVFGNAEFDMILALGIAMGACFERISSSPLVRYIGVTGARTLMAATLMLRLFATDRHEPLLVMLDSDFKRQFVAAEQAVYRESKQIAAIKGNVYCTVKVVCRAAGKPFAVDDFTVEQLVATRLISQSDLDELLRLRHITTFKNGLGTTGSGIDVSPLRAFARANAMP